MILGAPGLRADGRSQPASFAKPADAKKIRLNRASGAAVRLAAEKRRFRRGRYCVPA
jgi:hypothetical protein